jgi:hypothetical protein
MPARRPGGEVKAAFQPERSVMTENQHNETLPAGGEQDETRLADEDKQLVDLVSAALVDPNLHTDVRMRLCREITEILRSAHEDLYGPTGHEVHRHALEAHGDHISPLLTSVLVDPNLHTDTRMRLYSEIYEMLQAPDGPVVVTPRAD